MSRKIYVFLTMALIGILLLVVPALAQDDTESKDLGVPSGGGVAPNPTGSDTYGNTWYDQSTGECDYQFIDISATGALVVDGDDVSSGAISLSGNDFTFYGTTHTDLVMASNGYISTDPTDGGPDLSNDCPLPAPPSTGGGARIYPVHDDVVASSTDGGGGYYEWFSTCPRPADMWDHSGGNSLGCHVFHWNNARHFGDNNLFDFQVILYETTNEIAMMIPDGNPENGGGSTTGIQNDGATDGATYACNDATTFPAAQDTAVCFFAPNAPTDVSLAGFDGGVTTSPLWTALAVALVTVAAVGVFVSLRARQES